MRTQMFLWLILGAQSLVLTLADEPKPDAVSSPSVVLDEAANKIRDVAKQLTDNPMPTPAPVLVVAPELWIPFGPDNKRLDSPALIGAASEKDGSYMLLGLPKPGEEPQYRMITIVTLTGPRPPPAPPKPGPKPDPDPTPDPPAPDGAIARAYFVFVDRWNDRDTSADLLALGPSASEWAAIRAAGHKVLNLDADSTTAQSQYKSFLGDSPVLLVFDLDAKGPSGGPKFIGPKPVKNLADVRAVYKATTGKELP